MGEQKRIHPFQDIKGRKFNCIFCLDDPRGKVVDVDAVEDEKGGQAVIWLFEKCTCGNGKENDYTAYVRTNGRYVEFN